MVRLGGKRRGGSSGHPLSRPRRPKAQDPWHIEAHAKHGLLSTNICFIVIMHIIMHKSLNIGFLRHYFNFMSQIVCCDIWAHPPATSPGVKISFYPTPGGSTRDRSSPSLPQRSFTKGFSYVPGVSFLPPSLRGRVNYA
jgi:hypothetical protein